MPLACVPSAGPHRRRVDAIRREALTWLLLPSRCCGGHLTPSGLHPSSGREGAAAVSHEGSPGRRRAGGRAAPGDASFCYWLGACAAPAPALSLSACSMAFFETSSRSPALVWITLYFSGCS